MAKYRMRPICPKCGSVRVHVTNAKKHVCREPDCGHVGTRAAFSVGGPKIGWSAHEKRERRDPVAMSMDGYDGSGS